jgi:hypothetical protein
LLSSSLSVGGDDVRGLVAEMSISVLVRGGLDGASVCRRCLNAECSRYPGRGNTFNDGGGVVGPRALEGVLGALGGLSSAPLALRVREGDADVEGTQELSAARNVSARMTLGSNTVRARGDICGGMPENWVTDRAVERDGGDVAKVELPRTPVRLRLLYSSTALCTEVPEP